MSTAEMVDISAQLSKMYFLGNKLSKDLFEKLNELSEKSEEREEMEALYWIADTIRETAEKAYTSLYPNERP